MPEQKGKHFSRSQGRIQRLGLNLNGIEGEVKGLVMTEERNTSRDSVGRLKTQKHTALFNTTIPASETLSASTAASGILNIQSSMTNQSTATTANTTATSKTSKQPALIHTLTAPAAEGLNPSSQTGSAVGPTASKLRSPNMRHNLKPQADANISAKTSPKNIQKTTSASHVLGSVDFPKTLQKTASTSQISSTDPPKSLNRNSLSHIPRPASSPKLKPPHTAASVKVDKTERNKRQLSTSQKDRMIDRPSESKLEPGTNTALVKSPQRQQEQEMKSRKQREGEKLGDEGGKAGGTSALQGTQVEKSLAGNDITVLSTMGYKHSPLTENKKAPSTEHLKEPEDKIDAYVKTQGRQHDMERQTEMRDRESETLWERIGRDEEGKEEIKTREREGEEMEVQKMKTEGKKENLDTEVKKERNQTSKKLTDAGTMTVEDLIGETQDAALQTDRCLAYVDAEIQANVEVCSKSTYMSPIHKPSACGQLNHELDLGHKVSLYSALSPDSNSDSDGLSNLASPDPTPLGLKPRFLGPPPYKSPNIHKSLKHVCQIDIELCSQSAQSNSLTQVTVSEFNATCHDALVSHGASENNSKTAKMDGEVEENGVPQDIVWDEKGMTWEVYGASLDMESLGFAIQNHLQCKIREHERRIGTLRKSICLSEHSPGNNKTGKKKGNVFRSLCGGSKCCSKQPKESVPN